MKSDLEKLATDYPDLHSRVDKILELNEQKGHVENCVLYWLPGGELAGFTLWTKDLIIVCEQIAGSIEPYNVISAWRDPPKLCAKCGKVIKKATGYNLEAATGKYWCNVECALDLPPNSVIGKIQCRT